MPASASMMARLAAARMTATHGAYLRVGSFHSVSSSGLKK
jgi:hypothetical protein